MKSIFNNEAKITQEFGKDFFYNGKWYYKDNYGMLGHNGIDFIPTIDIDWSVFNIFSGQIIFSGWHNDYGNRIGIWNKEKKIVEWFNHLDFIDLNIKTGIEINEKTYLGRMGNTGKSFGAHVHYQICKVDDKCNRIEYNNGYFGYCNPMEYL